MKYQDLLFKITKKLDIIRNKSIKIYESCTTEEQVHITTAWASKLIIQTLNKYKRKIGRSIYHLLYNMTMGQQEELNSEQIKKLKN